MNDQQALKEADKISDLVGQAIVKAEAETSQMEEIWNRQRKCLADFQDHQKAMELSIASIKSGNMQQAEGLNKYAAQLDEYALHLRQAKSLLSTEMTTLNGHMKEMRRLCLDPDNMKAIVALNEFITAVTKLSELKANGTLDAIAGLFTRPSPNHSTATAP